MSPFLNRSRSGEDPLLEWKVRLFGVGAVFGLAGMYFEERWMTGGGIIVLAVAMFVRFSSGGRGAGEDGQDGADDFDWNADGDMGDAADDGGAQNHRADQDDDDDEGPFDGGGPL